MKTALTIAGSDSSGGAGIQADIKTMCANGVFAMSAITALTAQNTCGVTDIMEASPQFLKEQLDCIFTDIRPDAVKIGMVSSGALIETIADSLKQYGAERIVVDPVMAATSGARLIDEEAIATLKERALGRWPCSSRPISRRRRSSVRWRSMMKQTWSKRRGISSSAIRAAVLIKGRAQINDAKDYLQTADHGQWFYGKQLDNPNTHGTGCTLSSAIAANLAKGFTLDEAIRRAKEYISGALSAMLDLGKGSGPMDHAFDIHSRFMEEA